MSISLCISSSAPQQARDAFTINNVPFAVESFVIEPYGKCRNGTWTVEKGKKRCYYVRVCKFDTAKPGKDSYRPQVMQQPILPTGYCKTCLTASQPLRYVFPTVEGLSLVFIVTCQPSTGPCSYPSTTRQHCISYLIMSFAVSVHIP